MAIIFLSMCVIAGVVAVAQIGVLVLARLDEREHSRSIEHRKVSKWALQVTDDAIVQAVGMPAFLAHYGRWPGEDSDYVLPLAPPTHAEAGDVLI